MRVYRVSNLQLGPAEKLALRKNGFVARERRGASTIYKLRFRVGRQQHVRYLGRDPAVAEAVCAELAAWQAPRRLNREHQQALKYARRVVREITIRLAPHVAAAGLRLHGHAIRKPRDKRSGSPVEVA